jgi:isopenicillin-N epimerase
MRVPSEIKISTRRHFLSSVCASAAGMALLPRLAQAGLERFAQEAEQWHRLGDATAFWRLVRQQYILRSDLIMLNAANLSPASRPVLETLEAIGRSIDADPSFTNREHYEVLHDASRRALAHYLGADVDEIAITRNTSESNNIVVTGLTLGVGDEVVLWEQNHPSNNVAWDVRAARYGFTVKRVSTPADPTSVDDLLAPFANALSPRSRVLAITHVGNESGVMLPVERLCRMARAAGLLTLVDGAQSFGALHVDVHRMGCDFYTGSCHKWLGGPKEAGVLFVRRAHHNTVWPAVVSTDWREEKHQGARKFTSFGQRNDATLAAVGMAIDFHGAIGQDRIEARVRALAAATKETLRATFPNVVMRTPQAAELSAGIVCFNVPGTTLDMDKAHYRMYAEHQVACDSWADELPGMRFCTNIYNTPEDVQRAVAALQKLLES